MSEIKYNQTTWKAGKEGGTPISPANLNNIESGIGNLVTAVNELSSLITFTTKTNYNDTPLSIPANTWTSTGLKLNVNSNVHYIIAAQANNRSASSNIQIGLFYDGNSHAGKTQSAMAGQFETAAATFVGTKTSTSRNIELKIKCTESINVMYISAYLMNFKI